MDDLLHIGCPALPGEIPLISAGREFGSILPHPLHSQPQLVQDLAAPSSFPAEPVYLDRTAGAACAYPIRIYGPLLHPNVAEQILGFRDPMTPTPFGTPTSLQVGGGKTALSGLIFDRSRDLFFSPTANGLRWYTVGDSRNFSTFLQGIYRFADAMHSQWERDPDSIYSMIPWELGGEAPTSIPDPKQAYREIHRFLSWLFFFDAELYRDIGANLKYAERYDSGIAGCETDLSDTAYAFYNPVDGQAYLMPWAIHMLTNGEYQKVAQILAHERGHQRAHQRGLAIPSQEMLHHSLTLFLSNLVDEGLETGKADLIYQAASCNLLPWLPEEEFQAFGAELNYAQIRRLDDSTQELQIDAHLYSQYLVRSIGEYFPPEWYQLATQYVELARQ